MQNDSQQFFTLALKAGALRFGDFTLKSGRASPYFFNAGLFNDGAALAALGALYACAIMRHITGDFMLYGPAYKGITLAAATAMALNREHQRTVSFAFNRKEQKKHGEGGGLIGAPLTGDVVIVDDVITTSSSIAKAVGIIESFDARVAAVFIALDRQERRTNDNESAVSHITRKFNIPVHAIATFDELMQFIQKQNNSEPGYHKTLQALRSYEEQYVIASCNAS